MTYLSATLCFFDCILLPPSVTKVNPPSSIYCLWLSFWSSSSSSSENTPSRSTPFTDFPDILFTTFYINFGLSNIRFTSFSFLKTIIAKYMVFLFPFLPFVLLFLYFPKFICLILPIFEKYLLIKSSVISLKKWHI